VQQLLERRVLPAIVRGAPVTEARRRQAAEHFRSLLDDKDFFAEAIAEGKKPRELAMQLTCKKFNCDRASVYRWCARFKISTR
jgi:hypothetical protein